MERRSATAMQNGCSCFPARNEKSPGLQAAMWAMHSAFTLLPKNAPVPASRDISAGMDHADDPAAGCLRKLRARPASTPHESRKNPVNGERAAPCAAHGGGRFTGDGLLRRAVRIGSREPRCAPGGCALLVDGWWHRRHLADHGVARLVRAAGRGVRSIRAQGPSLYHRWRRGFSNSCPRGLADLRTGNDAGDDRPRAGGQPENRGDRRAVVVARALSFARRRDLGNRQRNSPSGRTSPCSSCSTVPTSSTHSGCRLWAGKWT